MMVDAVSVVCWYSKMMVIKINMTMNMNIIIIITSPSSLKIIIIIIKVLGKIIKRGSHNYQFKDN